MKKNNLKNIIYKIQLIFLKFSLFFIKKEKYINKKLKKFHELQNKAKYFNNEGDLRSSFYYNNLSYDELGKFAICCNFHKLDQIQIFNNFYEKIKNK
jgi:hypothetical protein